MRRESILAVLALKYLQEHHRRGGTIMVTRAEAQAAQDWLRQEPAFSAWRYDAGAWVMPPPAEPRRAG